MILWVVYGDWGVWYFYIVYYEGIDVFWVVCCDWFVDVVFESFIVVWCVFEVFYVCNVIVIYFVICSFCDEVWDDVGVVLFGDFEVFWGEVVFVNVFGIWIYEYGGGGGFKVIVFLVWFVEDLLL